MGDKKIGRPKATKLSRGRPKGMETIMKDYRLRMLRSPKSRKVLESIFDAALDDDHKHQAAAWKLIVDRIAPVSTFTEASGKKTGGIEINITGLSADARPVESIDAEFKEVESE